jgi:predicted dehydrogenase
VLAMIGVGVVGFGYWGPNLARNFHRNPRFSLRRIADLDARRLSGVPRDWPGVEVTTSFEDLLRDPAVEAVAIATPTNTHYELASEVLRRGKHVLVEKPLADSVERAERLEEEARRQGRVLLVDHTFVYTEAVRWMRDFVRGGELGELYYFDSIRTNLGLFQRDVSVLWDLAPHDLSILYELAGGDIRSVACTGASHAGSRVPDIAYLNLDLGEGRLAHFHVSWLSPVKIRRTVVSGSRRMMVWDDLELSEKVKVYDSGVQIAHDDTAGKYRMQVEYRVGDMTSPALPAREALQSEVEHFARCIAGEEAPRTGGAAGITVVRVLEAAERSLQRDGERIHL